jgi:hypothetical protein
VERNRCEMAGASGHEAFPGALKANVQGRAIQLSYLKLSEKDDKHRYNFDAEYPQLAPEKSTDAAEINLTLAAFVVRQLQRFRARAIGASRFKQDDMMKRGSPEMCWDRLSISHAIGGFTSNTLSVDFQFAEYGAGAAHSRQTTQTFNYLLKPATELGFWDIFRYQNRQTCIETISRYCIFSLNEQKPEFLKADSNRPTDWILRGAAAEEQNFKQVLLERGGVRFFFDPYSVACYAEGRYDVFVPVRVLSSMMHDAVLRLL